MNMLSLLMPLCMDTCTAAYTGICRLTHFCCHTARSQSGVISSTPDNIYRPICVCMCQVRSEICTLGVSSFRVSHPFSRHVAQDPIRPYHLERAEKKWRPFLDLDKGKNTHTIVERAERTEAQEEVTEPLIMLTAHHSAVF